LALCLVGLLAAQLAGCGRSDRGRAELEARELVERELLEDFQAVTSGVVAYVEVPSSGGGPATTVVFDTVPDGPELLASDLTAIIATAGAKRPEVPELAEHATMDIRRSSWELLAVAQWPRPDAGSEAPPGLIVIGFAAPYTDAFCVLPDLVWLGAVDGVSDFSRIAECNPRLSTLGIADGWNDSTGRDSLTDLRALDKLMVGGLLSDPGAFPTLRRLADLSLQLEEDTPANRALIEDRAPNAEILFARVYG
jgi:hypothetical protein